MERKTDHERPTFYSYGCAIGAFLGLAVAWLLIVTFGFPPESIEDADNGSRLSSPHLGYEEAVQRWGDRVKRFDDPVPPSPLASSRADEETRVNGDGFEIVRARPVQLQTASAPVVDDDEIYLPSDDEMVEIESGEVDLPVPEVPLSVIPADRSNPSRPFASSPFTVAATSKPLPSRKAWLADFNRTRREKIKSFPLCEACGRDSSEAGGHLDMHHVISVERIIHGKLDRKLLTDADNMIMLCRGTVSNCHFEQGHTVDGHSSWSISDPEVRSKAAARLKDRWPGWTYGELVDDWRSRLPLRAKDDPSQKTDAVRGRETRAQQGKRDRTPAKTTVAP